MYSSVAAWSKFLAETSSYFTSYGLRGEVQFSQAPRIQIVERPQENNVFEGQCSQLIN